MSVNLSLWRVAPQEIIINNSLFLRKWSQQDALIQAVCSERCMEEEMKAMNIYTMHNISVGNSDLNTTYIKM